MADIIIRDCNQDDVDILEDANRSDDFTQYGFSNFINQPECEERCIVAQDADTEEAVGFMLSDTYRGNERIYTSLVRPNYRRQRIMTHLFSKMLNEMAKCDADKIVLNVRSHKKGNIEAYKMGGFKEIRRVPHYYGNGDTAVNMEYDLNKFRKYLDKKLSRDQKRKSTPKET